MTDKPELLERTRELAAKLIDGELAAEEAEELTQLLQGGEERWWVLADHLLLDSLLSKELGKNKGWNTSPYCADLCSQRFRCARLRLSRLGRKRKRAYGGRTTTQAGREQRDDHQGQGAALADELH